MRFQGGEERNAVQAIRPEARIRMGASFREHGGFRVMDRFQVDYPCLDKSEVVLSEVDGFREFFRHEEKAAEG